MIGWYLNWFSFEEEGQACSFRPIFKGETTNKCKEEEEEEGEERKEEEKGEERGEEEEGDAFGQLSGETGGERKTKGNDEESLVTIKEEKPRVEWGNNVSEGSSGQGKNEKFYGGDIQMGENASEEKQSRQELEWPVVLSRKTPEGLSEMTIESQIATPELNEKSSGKSLLGFNEKMSTTKGILLEKEPEREENLKKNSKGEKESKRASAFKSQKTMMPSYLLAQRLKQRIISPNKQGQSEQESREGVIGDLRLLKIKREEATKSSVIQKQRFILIDL